jgi:hypothetical protein
MRQKKAETDRLFLLYQQEKDKKRSQDAKATAESHLKQAVSLLQNNSIKILSFYSKNEKIVNVV